MRKWWLLGIGTVLVAAAIFVFFKFNNKDEASAAPTVSTTQVRKGTIDVSVSGTGSIAPADKVTVNGPGQGTIGEVKVKEDDKVKKGAVLATIEGADNSDKIKSSQLDLDKKLLQLQSTQEQLKTAADDDQIANIKLNIEQQQLDIQSTRDTIANLQKEEQPETITAPIDGTVTTVSVAAGDSVNPSAALFEIADYDHLQIVVAIDELDISKVKIGQSAAISVEALSDKSYTGKVVKIADEGTSNNGVASFDVTISIDKPDGLKSGMSAEATIQVEKKDNVLMLPIDAVQSFGGRYVVFLPQSEASGQQNGGSGAGQAGIGGGGGFGAGQAAGQGAGQSASAGQGGNSGNGRNFGGGGYFGGGGKRTESGGTGGYFGGGTRQSESGGNASRQSSRLASRFGGGIPRAIQVGIHNEDYIEVVSGLTEGERVILPTVTTTATTNQQQNQRFGGAGLGGLGGAAGFGGGGFGGGGFGGGQRAFNGGGGGARSNAGTGTSGGGSR